mmetsp:Transcript_34797/g.92923  ORF Transcript_34797/g.92923 Transcript_34797/m.92923 type:complete len:296 (+) Transcript_34797:113-1000(+)
MTPSRCVFEDVAENQSNSTAQEEVHTAENETHDEGAVPELVDVRLGAAHPLDEKIVVCRGDVEGVCRSAHRDLVSFRRVERGTWNGDPSFGVLVVHIAALESRPFGATVDPHGPEVNRGLAPIGDGRHTIDVTVARYAIQIAEGHRGVNTGPLHEVESRCVILRCSCVCWDSVVVNRSVRYVAILANPHEMRTEHSCQSCHTGNHAENSEQDATIPSTSSLQHYVPHRQKEKHSERQPGPEGTACHRAEEAEDDDREARPGNEDEFPDVRRVGPNVEVAAPENGMPPATVGCFLG